MSNNVRFFGSKKKKGFMGMTAKIGKGCQCLREMELRFNNNYIM